MKSPRPFCKRSFLLATLFALAGLAPLTPRAELIRLINGDVYHGKLLTVDADHVVIQSEIQGQIQLPRNKVARIDFQNPEAKPTTASPTQIQTETSTESEGAPREPEEVVRQIQKQGVDPDTLAQIQKSFLGAANPEAQQQFNQMIHSLATGQLSIQDLREKARDSVNQIRQYRDLLEEEAGPMLDSYLSILENFLQETEPSGQPEEKAQKEKPE